MGRTRWFLCLVVFACTACSGSGTEPAVDVAIDSGQDTQTADLSAEDLGEDTAAEPDSGQVQAPPVATVHRAGVYAVERTDDVVYAQGQIHDGWNGEVTGLMDLKLDVYEPSDAPVAARPVLVIIHGGGFVGGSKTQGQLVNFANYFTARGWVCFSVDYRVVEQHGTYPADWPEQIVSEGLVPTDDQVKAMYASARDVKAAVRWIRAHAEEYGVHPDYLSAMGGSAGAFLAIMLGVTDDPDYRDELSLEEDPSLATTNQEQSSRIQTIVDLWGGITHMELLELRDGVNRYDATDAPVVIMHGIHDDAVTYMEAEKLVARYEETGVPYLLYPLDAGHGAWTSKVGDKRLTDLAFDFIVEQQGLTVVEPNGANQEEQ